MARNAFYSFHYQQDSWRASQVRNMGVVDGNRPASDNDWESIKKGGDAAIKKWIDSQLVGRSVVVVLIGQYTANRKWINYEIEKGWDSGKGVLGVHIQNLKDQAGSVSLKGLNPFAYIKRSGKTLSEIVRVYDAAKSSSSLTYEDINNGLPTWIETAITIRSNHV